MYKVIAKPPSKICIYDPVFIALAILRNSRHRKDFPTHRKCQSTFQIPLAVPDSNCKQQNQEKIIGMLNVVSSKVTR